MSDKIYSSSEVLDLLIAEFLIFKAQLDLFDTKAHVKDLIDDKIKALKYHLEDKRINE